MSKSNSNNRNIKNVLPEFKIHHHIIYYSHFKFALQLASLEVSKRLGSMDFVLVLLAVLRPF